MAKTILVPHDGNAMSDTALRYAIEIAKSMNMRIKLVRIIPEILDFSTLSFWTEAERRRVRREVKLMKKKALEAEYEKLQKQISLMSSRGVEGSAYVTEGIDVVEEIVRMIRKERPYLVVVGSNKLKQRGRLSRIQLLGSVARRLSEQSLQPVLVVK
ncbi:MAG TPA: universal stress protein [Nitrososphaera sp.]